MLTGPLKTDQTKFTAARQWGMETWSAMSFSILWGGSWAIKR